MQRMSRVSANGNILLSLIALMSDVIKVRSELMIMMMTTVQSKFKYMLLYNYCDSEITDRFSCCAVPNFKS